MSRREEDFHTALVFNAECKPAIRKHPGHTAHLFYQLTRLSAKALRQEVELCNNSTYCNAQRELGYPDREKIEKKLKELSKLTGLKFEYPNDPRGCGIRFETPRTGCYNSLSGNWSL